MAIPKLGWLLVVGLVLGVVACGEKKVEPVVKPAPTFSTVDIGITGMHCDGCAMTINDALKEADGVVECQVSFTEKKATVKYDPTRVAPAQLVAIIEKTGYRTTAPGARAGSPVATPPGPPAASEPGSPPAKP